MGIIFTGAIPAITGPVQLEVPTATYSGISDDTDVSVSINPYTNQGPGASGSGQTATEVEESRESGGSSIIGDPNFLNVNLLLHFDGDLTDNSNNDHQEVSNTGTITTDQAKFGTHSIRFNSSSLDVLTYGNSDDTFRLGSGEFTMECWIYPVSLPSSLAFIVDTRGGTGGFIFGLRSTGSIQFFVSGASSLITSNTVTLNEWNHVAYSRVNGTVYGFINGQLGVSGANSISLDGTNSLAYVGGPNNGGAPNYLNAYIDDLRITKGVGRYSANFDVPTNAFSDS